MTLILPRPGDNPHLTSAPQLVFVMGATNAGKSTLMDIAAKTDKAAVVEVGKHFRKKYSPDHFKGQNNPKHTADEAWQVMLDQIKAGQKAGAAVIFIDGQPRDVKQAFDVCHDPRLSEYPKRFINLYAPWEVRIQRALDRDSGWSQVMRDTCLLDLRGMTPTDLVGWIAEMPVTGGHESLRLSLLRMVNDYRGNYEVLSVLSREGAIVETIDTSFFKDGDMQLVVDELMSQDKWPTATEFEIALNQCEDGEVEIDSNAVTSRGDDNGTYVSTWMWVADPEEGDDDELG